MDHPGWQGIDADIYVELVEEMVSQSIPFRLQIHGLPRVAVPMVCRSRPFFRMKSVVDPVAFAFLNGALGICGTPTSSLRRYFLN